MCGVEVGGRGGSVVTWVDSEPDSDDDVDTAIQLGGTATAIALAAEASRLADRVVRTVARVGLQTVATRVNATASNIPTISTPLLPWRGLATWEGVPLVGPFKLFSKPARKQKGSAPQKVQAVPVLAPQVQIVGVPKAAEHRLFGVDSFALKSLAKLYSCEYRVAEACVGDSRLVTVSGLRAEDVEEVADAITSLCAVGPEGAPLPLISGVPVPGDAHMWLALEPTCASAPEPGAVSPGAVAGAGGGSGSGGASDAGPWADRGAVGTRPVDRSAAVITEEEVEDWDMSRVQQWAQEVVGVPADDVPKVTLVGKDLVTMEMCEVVAALMAQGVSKQGVDCVYLAVVDGRWSQGAAYWDSPPVEDVHVDDVGASGERGATSRDVMHWTPDQVVAWGRVGCGLSEEDSSVLRNLNGEQLLGYPAYPTRDLVGDLTQWGMTPAGAHATAAAYQAQRWVTHT